MRKLFLALRLGKVKCMVCTNDLFFPNLNRNCGVLQVCKEIAINFFHGARKFFGFDNVYKKRYVGGRYKEQLVLGWYKRFVEKFDLLICSKENVTCFLIV